jgi:hypothetical protein
MIPVWNEPPIRVFFSKHAYAPGERDSGRFEVLLDALHETSNKGRERKHLRADLCEIQARGMLAMDQDRVSLRNVVAIIDELTQAAQNHDSPDRLANTAESGNSSDSETSQAAQSRTAPLTSPQGFPLLFLTEPVRTQTFFFLSHFLSLVFSLFSATQSV